MLTHLVYVSKTCKEKGFRDWSMAYLSENNKESIAQKFVAEKGFNPRGCTADNTANLLCFFEETRQQNARDTIL